MGQESIFQHVAAVGIVYRFWGLGRVSNGHQFYCYCYSADPAAACTRYYLLSRAEVDAIKWSARVLVHNYPRSSTSTNDEFQHVLLVVVEHVVCPFSPPLLVLVVIQDVFQLCISRH
jgi:hypothetical protein